MRISLDSPRRRSRGRGSGRGGDRLLRFCEWRRPPTPRHSGLARLPGGRRRLRQPRPRPLVRARLRPSAMRLLQQVPVNFVESPLGCCEGRGVPSSFLNAELPDGASRRGDPQPCDGRDCDVPRHRLRLGRETAAAGHDSRKVVGANACASQDQGALGAASKTRAFSGWQGCASARRARPARGPGQHPHRFWSDGPIQPTSRACRTSCARQ
jgi:hypothetical protein